MNILSIAKIFNTKLAQLEDIHSTTNDFFELVQNFSNQIPNKIERIKKFVLFMTEFKFMLDSACNEYQELNRTDDDSFSIQLAKLTIRVKNNLNSLINQIKFTEFESLFDNTDLQQLQSFWRK